MDLGRAQLRVVKEQGRFGCTVTIVRYVVDCDAKNAYVSFSNVTAADFGASAASDEGVTDREVILPLMDVSIAVWHNHQNNSAYQKLKKSLTSFSLV
jgi:hypothetical protein